MTRTGIRYVILPLVAALLMAVIPASASQAVVVPERTIMRTLMTDTLPTKVELGLNGKGYKTVLYRVCVQYAHGMPREVRVTNSRFTNLKVRVTTRGVKQCYYPNAPQTFAYTRVRVLEDLFGPWNPAAHVDVHVW